MRALALISLVAAAACAQSDAVNCGDYTCPGGTVCERTRHLCIAPGQQTVCTQRMLADGDRCSVDEFQGICQSNLCLPGCGDGALSPGEECDDGNFASHDGCSSGCLVEIPSWEQERDGWEGVNGLGAVYHTGLARLVLVGGLDRSGLRTAQWQRVGGGFTGFPAGAWSDVTAKIGTVPPPRESPMVAYDSTRNVLVLFGGNGPAPLNDTWEYAVAQPYEPGKGVWTKINTPTSPPARYQGVMAYHAGRNRTVLFGGQVGNVGYADTWEYDGATWTKITEGAPSARILAAMAYDASRGELVMFGGYGNGALDETWTYGASGTWTNQGALSPRPAARIGAAMTYFELHSKVVLFGGANALLANPNDTWEYSAGAWTQVVTQFSPPGRDLAALAYDPQVSNIVGPPGAAVLVGGVSLSGSQLLDDVWEFTGTDWHEVTPSFAPPPRYGPMTYIPEAREGIIVAGFGAGGFLRDSWSYPARHFWALLDSSTFPAVSTGAFGHALSYDPRRDRVVMFGGEGTDRTYELARLTHQWTTTARTWDEQAVSRDYAGLGWDGRGGELVMFGGERGGAPLDTTFEYNGTTWKQIVSPGPSPTTGPAIAWDYDDHELVLFDSAGVTWIYRDHAWARLFPLDTDMQMPPGRNGGGFAYNYDRRTLVLLGGSTPSGAALADAWELDVATATWHELYVPPGGPLPRTRFGFIGHRNTRSLVIFGGQGGGGQNGDTWHLQFSSATPEEDCTDGTGDQDGDLQPDTRDPDCGEGERCHDGTDNDRDGLADMDDPECQL